METSLNFCEGFYFPATREPISTVNLRVQDRTWFVRRKIVNNNRDYYSYTSKNMALSVELERTVSSESVDVHLILFMWKNNDFYKKYTNIVTIPKDQKKIEIPVCKYSYGDGNLMIGPLVSLKGMICMSFLDSFKTDDNEFKNISSKGLLHAAISSQLFEDFSNLQDSDASSDFVLMCAGEEFRVHKCILAARSSVFAAMFRFHDKIAEAQDSKITRSVALKTETMSCRKRQKVQDCVQENLGPPNLTEDIVDLKPEILRKVLKYIYSGQIDDLSGDVEAGDLLYAADKYQLVLLKDICVEKLKSTLSVSNVLDMLVIGDLHDQSLKAHAMDFICKYPSLSEMKKMDKWTSLQTTHPTMVIEVLTSVVGYLQDSKIPNKLEI